MSRPDPFDPPRPGDAPIPSGEDTSVRLEDGLSLAELATALSAHGGGALSADLALDLMLNEIVEHARLATGATAAAIALTRGDEIVCRATTGDNAPGLGVRLEAHSGFSGACVQSRKWQRCDDTETDSRVDAEVCRSLGVRSILVYPVLSDDKLLGVFEIFSPRPNAFSDREIQTLEALSRSIVNNVGRAADVMTTPAPDFQSPSTDVSTADSITPLVNFAEVVSASTEVVPDAGSRSDVPISTAKPLQEIEDNTKNSRREYWTWVLMLAVIAAAVFLGWMLGYVRKQRAAGAIKSSESTTAAATLQTQAPEPGTSNTSPALPPSSTRAAPAGSAPTSAQNNATNAPPAGGLVVYENGKVIFRTNSQVPDHSVKDIPVHTLSVPAKVADEYVDQRIEPEYPEQARDQHIQGPVVLVALVGKDGVVEKLSTVSGDPQLVAAATQAVKQWRFKPFFRNGSPEEFQTQITVSFRLP
jgi:TonB family protein